MRQKSQGTQPGSETPLGRVGKAGHREEEAGPMDSSPPPHPGGQDSEGLTCRDTKGPPSFGGERLRGPPNRSTPCGKATQARPFIKDREPFLLSSSTPSPGCVGGEEVFREFLRRYSKEHKTRSGSDALDPSHSLWQGAPGLGWEEGDPPASACRGQALTAGSRALVRAVGAMRDAITRCSAARGAGPRAQERVVQRAGRSWPLSSLPSAQSHRRSASPRSALAAAAREVKGPQGSALRGRPCWAPVGRTNSPQAGEALPPPPSPSPSRAPSLRAALPLPSAPPKSRPSLILITDWFS